LPSRRLAFQNGRADRRGFDYNWNACDVRARASDASPIRPGGFDADN
jgi:hypothetical protein